MQLLLLLTSVVLRSTVQMTSSCRRPKYVRWAISYHSLRALLRAVVLTSRRGSDLELDLKSRKQASRVRWLQAYDRTVSRCAVHGLRITQLINFIDFRFSPIKPTDFGDQFRKIFYRFRRPQSALAISNESATLRSNV